MKCRLMPLALPFTLGLVLLLSAAAGAAVHEGTDVLGLATAPDETGLFMIDGLTPAEFDLHLLVYGYDHLQGIVGWECGLDFPDGVTPLGATLTGKADPSGIDLAAGALRAFPREPLLPAGGVVHLATLHLLLTDDSRDHEFLLTPYPDADARMGFSTETAHANVTAFQWPNDCVECPVFVIVSTAEPAERSSWDLVKSLYR